MSKIVLCLLLFSSLIYADTDMTDEEFIADQNRAMCVDRGNAYSCLMAMGYKCEWLDRDVPSLICTPEFQETPRLKVISIDRGRAWLIEKLPDVDQNE